MKWVPRISWRCASPFASESSPVQVLLATNALVARSCEEYEPRPPFFDAFYVDPPQQADRSDLGGEETTDVLLKLAWTPLDDTLVNLKFNYTEGDDDHFPSQVPPVGVSQLNCFLPDPDVNPASGGAYCGTRAAPTTGLTVMP